jgi:hypothetical protein
VHDGRELKARPGDQRRRHQESPAQSSHANNVSQNAGKSTSAALCATPIGKPL